MQSFAGDKDDYKLDGDQYLSDACLRISEGEDVDLTDEPICYDLYYLYFQQQQNHNIDMSKIEFESKYDYSAHKRIAADALRIMSHDIGNSLYNGTYVEDGETKNYNDLFIQMAAEPDSSERGYYNGYNDDGSLKYSLYTNPLYWFSGHFYHPQTEVNNKDTNENTAKLNAKLHYDRALYFYKNGNTLLAFKELGKGTHYVMDACECHHATGEDAVASNNNHGEFEKQIDAAIQATAGWTLIGGDLGSGHYYDNSVYNEALQISVENIVRNNGYSSFPLLAKSKNSNNVDANDVVYATYKNAVMATVQYYYKFAHETGVNISFASDIN